MCLRLLVGRYCCGCSVASTGLYDAPAARLLLPRAAGISSEPSLLRPSRVCRADVTALRSCATAASRRGQGRLRVAAGACVRVRLLLLGFCGPTPHSACGSALAASARLVASEAMTQHHTLLHCCSCCRVLGAYAHCPRFMHCPRFTVAMVVSRRRGWARRTRRMCARRRCARRPAGVSAAVAAAADAADEEGDDAGSVHSARQMVLLRPWHVSGLSLAAAIRI